MNFYAQFEVIKQTVKALSGLVVCNPSELHRLRKTESRWNQGLEGIRSYKAINEKNIYELENIAHNCVVYASGDSERQDDAEKVLTKAFDAYRSGKTVE